MEILPRFQALATHQIDQKTSATDLVTEADLLAEKRLSALLLDLLPESIVVGEEACHDDPSLIGRYCDIARCLGCGSFGWNR